MFTYMPPNEYIHPVHKVEQVLHMTLEDLRKLCGNALACSWTTAKKCIIALPNNTHLNLGKLKIHEEAHCNGWPREHPNAHYEDVGDY